METNRQILLISGKQSNCLQTAKELCANLQTLIVDDPQKANQSLGQEFDAVIFNAFNNFDANAFGAVCGTIREGGYLLLLRQENEAKDSLFLSRFNRLLNRQENVFHIPAAPAVLRLSKPKTKKFSEPYATDDQQKAVEAIIHVVKGHRRRPLVITADRGRGKSAALGIAAAKLHAEGLRNILVCAPSKKTAAIIFKHAPDVAIQFYSPDELQQQRPKADLLLIDEAAAIPVPLLSEFLKHYSRIVFATTQHGYEGSGRGFAINFQKHLEKKSPGWKSCPLTQPIRWQENDSLEQFVFDALLLNAEPVNTETIKNVQICDVHFDLQNKQQLVADDNRLNTLFGLLVSAHYQTKPSDFMQMLDDVDIQIFSLTVKQHIVAVALVMREGNIDKQTAKDIFAGTRRLKGNLVAQSLAANVGIESAPCLQGQRILRIAVHPALQGQGFGTHLLQSLQTTVEADYLSTSFGATAPLLTFWRQSGYTPVYLSMKRDASSGTHSVIMLLPKNTKGKQLLKQARQGFSQSFPHLLSDPFRHLETDIALLLLSENQLSKNQAELTDSDNKIIAAFAQQQRGYENSFYPIWKLVCQRLATNNTLNAAEQNIILQRVLQKQPWSKLIKSGGGVFSGKKEGLSLLRRAIAKLHGDICPHHC